MTKSKDTLQKIYGIGGGQLAYRFIKGEKPAPTLVFLGGYRSDMMGTKAEYLSEFAENQGYSFLRFDYSGHGESDGDFRDGCIGDWTKDAMTIIQSVVDGDMILIGSSMGGWIGLNLAQTLGNKVKGFIGIAAAPDFTDWVWNHEMNEAQQILCKEQGYINTPDGDILTHKLFTDGAQHLIFNKPLNLSFPVTLLHGKMDDVVPYAVAQKLASHIISPAPTTLILIDDGDHRLARDGDLEILSKTIQKY